MVDNFETTNFAVPKWLRIFHLAEQLRALQGLLSVELFDNNGANPGILLRAPDSLNAVCQFTS
jgi:hypothetical protein